MTEIFKKVKGLPKKKGDYMTDHGFLPFDGKKFLMNIGKSFVPTTVEWYLEEAFHEDICPQEVV